MPSDTIPVPSRAVTRPSRSKRRPRDPQVFDKLGLCRNPDPETETLIAALDSLPPARLADLIRRLSWRGLGR